MRYPKGTKFGAWSLTHETQRGVRRPAIRRWVHPPNGKRRIERYPSAKFAQYRESPEELAKFLLRLNEDLRKERAVRDGVELRHAYIDRELIERYRRQRVLEVPSSRITTEFFYLQKHFLGFFINNLGLKSPQDWHRVHRSDWARYLLSDAVPKAPASKREIIQAANRFMKWLHEERKDVPELIFKPLSTERFRDLIARRELDASIKKRTYIRPKDWEAIVKSLPPEIAPFVHLAYDYGVRRGEALGMQPGDVKKGFLSVERQLERLEPTPTFKPTKGKMRRQVRHWFAKPEQAYAWIEAIPEYRVDPDHLTDLWNDLMDALGFTYDFHDLRHSFITRALREHPAREVQLAAGHKHLKTTMAYAHDDRAMDAEEWTPGAA